MNALLRQVRRRLRLAWAVATSQWLLPALAGGALALVGLGRLRPWAWPEPVAMGTVVGPLVLVGVAAIALRITTFTVARAADRGLATHDAFATALETRRGSVDPLFATTIERRAEQLATTHSGKDAVPLTVERRRLTVSLVVLAGAVTLALVPNGQDAVRQRRAADHDALIAQAAAVRTAADELARRPEAATAAATLRALADTLARAPSIERGQEALDRAVAALGANLPTNALAQKTAAANLERSLAAAPLPGAPAAGASAAAQLAGAAGQLADLDTAAREALAQRLQALSAGQAAGNPDVAAALAAAAGAVRADDAGAASAALSRAATAQQAATAAVAAQQATSQALRAATDAKGALARSAPGRSPGNGQGQGQGQGRGQGQGQGSGQGAGQGQGTGAPSGQVGGTNAATARGGQGGVGTPKGSGRNPSAELNTSASIYAPSNTAGDQLTVGGDGSDGPGEQQGKASGPNVATGSIVPLSDVLPAYQAQATAALDTMNIPASQRDLVRAYFDGLGNP